MEAIGEEQVVKKVPVEQLPKNDGSDMNPLGYTPTELIENKQWLKELQLKSPHIPEFIHTLCIDYYRLKGEEAIKKEMEDGQ